MLFDKKSAYNDTENNLNNFYLSNDCLGRESIKTSTFSLVFLYIL